MRLQTAMNLHFPKLSILRWIATKTTITMVLRAQTTMETSPIEWCCIRSLTLQQTKKKKGCQSSSRCPFLLNLVHHDLLWYIVRSWWCSPLVEIDNFSHHSHMDTSLLMKDKSESKCCSFWSCNIRKSIHPLTMMYAALKNTRRAARASIWRNTDPSTRSAKEQQWWVLMIIPSCSWQQPTILTINDCNGYMWCVWRQFYMLFMDLRAYFLFGMLLGGKSKMMTNCGFRHGNVT